MTATSEAVSKAIGEIRATFSHCQTDAEPDGSGGAFVLVRNVPLFPPYAQSEAWFGFQITFQYPYADVYPHFTRPDLARSDKKPLGEGFGAAQFRGQPATQISRRSNKLNPATDTASLKLLKVLNWMKTRP